MYITLTNDQVHRLRSYIDITESVRQAFTLAGYGATVQGSIDDTHAMLCVMVAAAPPAAVAVLNAKKLFYQTMDYHDDPRLVAATYRVEYLGHDVMVIASEAHTPADQCADAGNVVYVSSGDGMGGLNAAPDDRRYMFESSETAA